MFRRVNSSDSPVRNQTTTTSTVPSTPSHSSTAISNDESRLLQEEVRQPKIHYEHRQSSMSSFRKKVANTRGYLNSTRILVLLVLCLQNSLFTTLRRYSQGVLKETYSKHELLLLAEIIKLLYSSWMIQRNMLSEDSKDDTGLLPVPSRKSLSAELMYLVSTSKKMFVLALIYGTMNILSFVSLRNISAGMFTIFAQTKILTTATFSTIMLKRKYSWTKWRALIALMMGVLLFSEPIWGSNSQNTKLEGGSQIVGTIAVMIEVSLSGFASIYFEKVIKTDPLQLGIWERNFQLALGSIPVYVVFIIGNGGGTVGFFQGWSSMAIFLSALGAAGGMLVALSIKYGDSILKTLATTGAIVLTGVLDYCFLDGPMTPSMVIAGVQVIVAICNYTFDATSVAIMSSNNHNDANSSGGDLSKMAAAVADEEAPSSVNSREKDLMLRKNQRLQTNTAVK